MILYEMILYESRVKPTPGTATHLSRVYKLPETVVTGGIS